MLRLLDNLVKLRQLDHTDILSSVSQFSRQLEQAWEEIAVIKFPPSFCQVNNIILAGMGGSALGARFVKSLDKTGAKLPLEIINDYHLPGYADQKTLFIASSYSGNTEETVTCCREAVKNKCQVFVAATGGKLADLAKQNHLPSYIFTPINNPCGQPRIGIGYSIGILLALLYRLKLTDLTERQFKLALNYVAKMEDSFGPNVPTTKNPAKELARDFANEIIVLVAARHLTGASHTFKNQLNESAKTFAVKFAIPELNHHLMEGLDNPDLNRRGLHFLFFTSDFYEKRIQKRFKITQKVVAENRLQQKELKLRGPSQLAQALELISFGSYTSFYLAMLYGEDPSTIPWVDYFKKELA